MEDLQTQTTEPTAVPVQQPKKSHAATLSLAVCSVIFVAVVAGVYYWQHQKVSDLSKKNETLTSRLASAQKATPSQSAGSSTSSTISYTATVGKFTLTLPSTYAIVRVSDGPGEGGSSTSLEIGSKTSMSNIVDFYQGGQPTVFARPYHGSETFRSVVDGDLKDAGDTQKTSIKVDGVDAESYTYGGFGAPRAVYFTKNGIYYKISTPERDTASGKLEPIIAGFKFN